LINKKAENAGLAATIKQAASLAAGEPDHPIAFCPAVEVRIPPDTTASPAHNVISPK
jgi:hypothetical protein